MADVMIGPEPTDPFDRIPEPWDYGLPTTKELIMADTRTNQITNRDNVIDSRDVIARIEYLSGRSVITEEEAELTLLRELAREGEDIEDWQDGVILVRDSHFKEYAQEYAEEIDRIEDQVQWPYTCIDWDQAARELRMDYNVIDFDGVGYWYR